MTKVSKKYLDPKVLGYYLNNLWSAFTLMETKADIRLLFKDLFTPTEYKMFAKRLEIARRLQAGDSYESIVQELNVTSRTITSVSNVLASQGAGLRMAHEKLSRLEEKYRKRETARLKRMANPFAGRARRKTLLGGLVQVGVKELDKQIVKSLKRRSARGYLSQ